MGLVPSNSLFNGPLKSGEPSFKVNCLKNLGSLRFLIFFKRWLQIVGLSSSLLLDGDHFIKNRNILWINYMKQNIQ